ncbi:MAG: SCP2 sterol-binding domain-containing protein [Pseudomonadota bacterium]
MAPIDLTLIATINHLLAQDDWARRQLQPHAGKVAVFDGGALALRLRVGADGLLEAAPSDSVAQVTIGLKLADLPLMAQQPERAFSFVRIDGDAEFANTISKLSKTVRWEAAHDLERVVGPIAAARLVAGARAMMAAAGNAGAKLADNVAEYLLEERPVLVRTLDAAAFSADVTRLRDDVERAAKRIEKLEQKLARASAAVPPRLEH